MVGRARVYRMVLLLLPHGAQAGRQLLKSPRLRLLRGRVLYTCALGHMALTPRFSQSFGCACCEVAIRKRHGPNNNASGARARIDCKIIMAGHRPGAQAQHMRLHGYICFMLSGTCSITNARGVRHENKMNIMLIFHDAQYEYDVFYKEPMRLEFGLIVVAEQCFW